MSHIDSIPTPIPMRSDPTNFDARVVALLTALVAFVPEMNTAIDQVNASTAAAAAAAVSATNAPGTNGQSTTSLTIGAGNQAFTTQSGKNFFNGQWVTITRTSDVSKWMLGTASYNSTTGAMTVNVVATNGSGTFTDWTIGASPPLLLTAAVAAQIWAGLATNAALTPASLFAAAAPVTLTDGATISSDFGAGVNFSATLAGNRTLANPTNQKAGQSGLIAVFQDSSGSRTLAFGSNWKFPGGAPSLSTTAGATDVISYYVLTPGVILATLVRSFA